jgi:pilus assembly protein CpaC
LSQLWSGYALPPLRQNQHAPRSANPGRNPLKIRGALSRQPEPALTLAEPNLVALSGELAEFNAGGEFPYPVVQPGSVGQNAVVTIEFKEFGVYLRFVPTVLSDGVISMRLQPRVSDLDYTNGVTIQGTTVPSIIQRRANTTVELRDGQSFAIAGLMQASSFRDINQVPWLGTVPVLGTLFRSSDFQNRETELVVLVTPHIVKPVPPTGKDPKLKTPLDKSLAANDVDFFLMGRSELPKGPPTYPTPAGDQPVVEAVAPGAPAVQPPPESDPVTRFFDQFFAPAAPPQN